MIGITEEELELTRKRLALIDLEFALARGGNNFTLTLSEDGNKVKITDKDSGVEKTANVKGDSLGAMLLDVLRQAGDWIY